MMRHNYRRTAYGSSWQTVAGGKLISELVSMTFSCSGAAPAADVPTDLMNAMRPRRRAVARRQIEAGVDRSCAGLGGNAQRGVAGPKPEAVTCPTGLSFQAVERRA